MIRHTCALPVVQYLHKHTEKQYYNNFLYESTFHGSKPYKLIVSQVKSIKQPGLTRDEVERLVLSTNRVVGGTVE